MAINCGRDRLQTAGGEQRQAEPAQAGGSRRPAPTPCVLKRKTNKARETQATSYRGTSKEGGRQPETERGGQLGSQESNVGESQRFREGPLSPEVDSRWLTQWEVRRSPLQGTRERPEGVFTGAHVLLKTWRQRDVSPAEGCDLSVRPPSPPSTCLPVVGGVSAKGAALGSGPGDVASVLRPVEVPRTLRGPVRGSFCT